MRPRSDESVGNRECDKFQDGDAAFCQINLDTCYLSPQKPAFLLPVRVKCGCEPMEVTTGLSSVLLDVLLLGLIAALITLISQ